MLHVVGLQGCAYRGGGIPQCPYIINYLHTVLLCSGSKNVNTFAPMETLSFQHHIFIAPMNELDCSIAQI